MLNLWISRNCLANEITNRAHAEPREQQRPPANAGHDHVHNYPFFPHARIAKSFLRSGQKKRTHRHNDRRTASAFSFHRRKYLFCVVCNNIWQFFWCFFRSEEGKKRWTKNERLNVHSICGMTHHEHQTTSFILFFSSIAAMPMEAELCINDDCAFLCLIGGRAERS